MNYMIRYKRDDLLNHCTQVYKKLIPIHTQILTIHSEHDEGDKGWLKGWKEANN